MEKRGRKGRMREERIGGEKRMSLHSISQCLRVPEYTALC